MQEKKEMESKGSDTRLYEVAYLLVPTISEDRVADEANAIRTAIEGLDGLLVSSDYPKALPLAYEMIKVIEHKKETFKNAHFGTMKFQLPAEHIGALEDALGKLPTMLRFLIMKTSRESGYVPKRVFIRRERKAGTAAGQDKEGKPSRISEAELEKAIEELVS